MAEQKGLLAASAEEDWLRRLATLPLAGPVRPLILESWERSRAAGVIAETSEIRIRRVDDDELERRLSAARELIEAAAPHLEWLAAYMGDTPHAGYITDADGIVLHSVGEPEMRERFGLAPGHDWSEAKMGTNGAGTALASGSPVAVEGPEHFCLAFRDATCTGAPIYVDGRLVGAIDVSTSVADATPDRLTVVAHMAFVIGRELSNREQARRLESSVAEREQAAQQLRIRERHKDEFLVTLAHELRSPLASIRNALGILQASGASEAQRQWGCATIGRQTQHIARLLEDRLDLSRISRGALELRLEQVPLASVIERAVETALPLIEARRHALDVRWPDESIAVRADPTRLTQVLVNLLTNSAKYTDSGGRIRLEVRTEGHEVAIHLRDNGIGMSREIQARLFQMFSRGSEAMARSESGLGVGLVLARGLVALHGGSLEARSDGPGQGSEFVVRLPRGSAEHGTER